MIEYAEYTANAVSEAVQKGAHLKGFSVAANALETLIKKLKEVLFDAEWWRNQCEQEARAYEAMQRDLRTNPEAFSAERTREVCRKSPKKLYAYADVLKDGEENARRAIEFIEERMHELELAEFDAKEDTKKVTEKISYAMELMNEYLKVSF